MIILFVTHNFMVGGLEQVVIDIASLAKNKGHTPVIAYAGQIADSTREDVELAGIEHIRLPESEEERLVWLRERGVSLVNAHYATILARECKGLGIPYLQTIHNMYLWLHEEAIAAWRALDNFTSWYIAVSNKAAQVAVERLGLPVNKMTVVPNGVAMIDQKPTAPPERDEQLRRELGIPVDGVIFVQVATLHPVKAQWVTVNAFAEALKTRQDIYLILLGKDSDAAYAEKTREKIRQHGLERYIFMPGYRKDVARFLHLSRAMLVPSFVEGWSLAISEAIQLGVSVVATDVGDAREQLAGTGGILLPAFTEDFAGLNAKEYVTALTDEALHEQLAPPLTQAILEMAGRPARSTASPPTDYPIRRPKDAYAEHLEIMQHLVKSTPKTGEHGDRDVTGHSETRKRIDI
jgi:glycosyltransferase involved in cell wall biosynthesis